MPKVETILKHRSLCIGGGGCNNDAFSVFGFLAFLLAAANLFMAEERRKKRDTNIEGKDIND